MPYYYSPLRKQYGEKEAGTDTACVFCMSDIRKQALHNQDGKPVENDRYIWIVNYYPRYEGHTMLIPKKHITSFDQEMAEDLFARQELLSYASKILTRFYPDAGIECFLQTGKGSDASIRHHHWHVLPAQLHDPLRGIEKLGYYTTTEPKQKKVLIFPIEIQCAREALQDNLAPFISAHPYCV